MSDKMQAVAAPAAPEYLDRGAWGTFLMEHTMPFVVHSVTLWGGTFPSPKSHKEGGKEEKTVRETSTCGHALHMAIQAALGQVKALR